MDLGAAQGVEGDVFTSGDANHLRAGDEHVADLVDHKGEIGHRRRVNSPAGARSQDQAQLRDQAARLDVAPEDLGVPGQGDHALLDARSARVVDADDRDSVAQGHVHDLDHLLREHLAERAAEDGGVVAEQHHVAAVDLAHAGHDSITRNPLRFQAEALRAMRREDVYFLERVAIHQPGDALAGGELVLGMLTVEPLGVAVPGLVLALAQLIEWIDLVALRGCHEILSMNIQRWPSRSSTRYRLAFSSRSTSERIRAPAFRARSKW